MLITCGFLPQRSYPYMCVCYKISNLNVPDLIVKLAQLYLDERHTEWMSDRVLQHVLEDLRPRLETCACALLSRFQYNRPGYILTELCKN
jgi:hypothetical protein